MFPKRKLSIIIWKLCQISSRNRKTSPHSNKIIIIRDSRQELTYQKYNLVLPLVRN
jgi:hypothetical protein